MSFSWKGRHVLVTGATGILGPWMCAELVKRGSKVAAIVRDSVPSSNFHRMGLEARTAVESGELEDLAFVRRAIGKHKAEVVLHLGAQAIVGAANRSPLPTFEANIGGTVNVLEACRHEKGVKRIVVASSDKAYGGSRQLPYSEETRLEGEHPYDVSKSCADLITRSFYETYGLPVCTTRCGNIYGGGDLNFNRIVPGTIRSALRGEQPVIRSDGKYVRDYFYVKDTVEGYLTLAEKMTELGLEGEAFNFSSGNHLQVLEMVDRILGLMGSNLSPRVLNGASAEIREQTLSSRKAEKVLGWKPRYGLEKGLLETIAWYKDYFAGKE
ncbi:GDP-mannose 4,6-dehydratase [Candidatus Burarchaeum australiense]|nr:GDP-mannose 4,6-dehydratase [Candidatus Burarchaeum australiense]